MTRGPAIHAVSYEHSSSGQPANQEGVINPDDHGRFAPIGGDDSKEELRACIGPTTAAANKRRTVCALRAGK